MSVYKTAKYLVVHLKRFNHSGNRYIIYGEKVRTPIQLEKVEIINGEKYELFGVVNHFGSLSMGHYTAFVNREGEWYYADDSSFKRR
jgi:ubiquitin C-terminal hydrolase